MSLPHTSSLHSLPSSPPQELYENVKREEFKVPGGEGNLAETFFNPEREGWLTKEGGKYKSKHRRWFILKESMLYYFKQPTVSSTSRTDQTGLGMWAMLGIVLYYLLYYHIISLSSSYRSCMMYTKIVYMLYQMNLHVVPD